MARALQYNPAGEGLVEIGDTDTIEVGAVQLADGLVSIKGGQVLAGTTVVDSFADTSADAAVWNYVVKNGGNKRAGTITATWDPALNSTTMNEVSTADLGSTVGVTFSTGVVILTDMFELRVTTPGLGWTVLVDRVRLYEV